MLTSSGLPVCWNTPWEMIRCVSAAFTPSPVWNPLGTMLPFESVWPAGRSVEYIRSWKSMRIFLNPVVFTLARLWAITSMFFCCAPIPLAAVYMDRIMATHSSVQLDSCPRLSGGAFRKLSPRAWLIFSGIPPIGLPYEAPLGIGKEDRDD